MSAKIKQDLIVGVLIYAVLLAFFVQTNSLLQSSAFFPRMILGLFAFLNTIMIFGSFRKKNQDDKGYINIKSIHYPLLYFASIVLYAVLFRFLGYFPSTILLLVGSMIALKVKPLWKIAPIVVGYTSFIYLMFVLWLKVQLI